MDNPLMVIVLVIVFIVVALVLPQFLVMRTAPKVIRIFRQKNAVGAKNAKPIEELGLKQRSVIENMLRRRDYKPRALQLLISANIVQMTEDGKLYLDEESLSMTRWRMY
jgi:hypothetical protein